MIFDRVLVPLDGSRLAEASLPVAEALGRRLGSTLFLAHVLESEPPVRVHGQTHLASREDARAYLERQREHCASLGLSVESRIAGQPAEDVALALDDLARELDAGVIVMCAHGRRTLRDRNIDLVILVTHGRTGISAWYERSIAQRMLAEPGLTLLLLRESAPKPRVTCRR